MNTGIIMKDINPPVKPSTTSGKGKLIQDLKAGKSLNFDKAGMMRSGPQFSDMTLSE